MIERDDAWFLRLQEGVIADLDPNGRETSALFARLWKSLGAFVRGLTLVSHTIMGPPDPPKLNQAQLLAETRARRRERRAARRRARSELRGDPERGLDRIPAGESRRGS
jgi:hypothetical protein